MLVPAASVFEMFISATTAYSACSRCASMSSASPCCSACMKIGAPCKAKCCRNAASSVRKVAFLVKSDLSAGSAILLRSWTTAMVPPPSCGSVIGTESTQRVYTAPASSFASAIPR